MANDSLNPSNWMAVDFGGGNVFYPSSGATGQSLTPGTLPSLPPLGSIAQPGSSQAVLSGGGAGTGSLALPGGSVTVPTTPGTPGAGLTSPANPYTAPSASTASGPTTGSIADYFLRAVIIILGFIFVAIGLNMFRPGLIPNPIRT